MAKKYDAKARNLFNKDIPKMPNGYYSGDKPNPNLQAFVKSHANPSQPKAVETGPKTIHIANRRCALNDLHGFWSKKPYAAIEEYIRHFTRPDDLVLDPFCGSGGTGLVCQKLGRAAIMVDASPASAHITAGYSLLANTSIIYDIQKQVEMLIAECEQYWKFSSGANSYRISGILYSEMYQCLKCLKLNYVSIDIPDGDENKGLCECGENNDLRSRKTKFTSAVPVRLYLTDQMNGKRIQIPIDTSPTVWTDFGNHFKKMSKMEVPADFLSEPIAKELLDYGGRLRSTGALRVRDLYTPFGLNFLQHASCFIATLRRQEPEVAHVMQFLLTSCSLNFSRMYRARRKGGGLAGAFYIPPVFRQINPADSFYAKFSTFARAQSETEIACQNGSSHKILVSCQDAATISLPPNTVDYIFTDPPYADTMPYGALNCAWEAIIGADTDWRHQEARESQWHIKILNVMKICFDFLKPGAFISVCYHDTSAGSWQQLQDIMAQVGFLVQQSDMAIGIETNQKAYQQSIADKVTKRDLVINYRKPKTGEVTAAITIAGDEDNSTFNEKVRQIIRDYIETNPGTTKDRIYDEVVSCMVRSGQMEAHNFNELLSQVAEQVKLPVKRDLLGNEELNVFSNHDVGRWYLKETELAIADAAETAMEHLAAEKIGTFIEKHLKKHPSDEGVHYSDLFENYIYAVKDKPRRQLAEFLPDYFYKTEHGTWRFPASEEEERSKSEARAKGLGRRVKRYIAQLEQGVIIPDHERPNEATLAEWIRHCKRAGFYEHGKFLYEKGGLNPDNLTEEVMVRVEEDYQVCARMLTRSYDMETLKKRKRKT
jgi:DNA modification methylase